MHGRGKYYFKSGKIHEGEYLNNKYHGGGVMIWPDGRSYKGIIIILYSRKFCKFI
jgi:hypothetical protein